MISLCECECERVHVCVLLNSVRISVIIMIMLRRHCSTFESGNTSFLFHLRRNLGKNKKKLNSAWIWFSVSMMFFQQIFVVQLKKFNWNPFAVKCEEMSRHCHLQIVQRKTSMQSFLSMTFLHRIFYAIVKKHTTIPTWHTIKVHCECTCICECACVCAKACEYGDSPEHTHLSTNTQAILKNCRSCFSYTSAATFNRHRIFQFSWIEIVGHSRF